MNINSTFNRLGAAVDKLLAGGRDREAVSMALAAALKFPGNRLAAGILERTLSCSSDRSEVKRAYAALLDTGRACSAHYYNLAMFHKRWGNCPAMLSALKGLLAAPGGVDPVHSYIALCSLDRYAGAFAAAERLVSSAPDGEPVLSRLWNPWGDRSTDLPAGFMEARLRALGRADLPRDLEPYRILFKGSLLLFRGKPKAALAEFDRLPRMPAALRGWMHFPEGWAALRLRLYGRARAAFRKSAASPVSRMPSLGRLAEVEICSGREAEGFACFRRALKTAHFSQLPGLHTWKGQMLLFTGRYGEAETSLSEGGRLGDDAAWCWRGAARAKQGRLTEALRDLDKAVALFPTDLEALVWRAEVLRLLGRKGEAAADLEKVLLKSRSYPWALINRALCRAESGDIKGMAADFRRVDPEIKNFLERAVPSADGGRVGRVRRMLAQACSLAMGDRRDDRYFYPVWMSKKRFRRRRTGEGPASSCGILCRP